MANPDEVIRAAEEVAEILESRGVGAVVIGAVALAAHGYVRFTGEKRGQVQFLHPPFGRNCTCPRF